MDTKDLRSFRLVYEGVLCENADHEQVLVPGTSVICALGQRSRSKLAEVLLLHFNNPKERDRNFCQMWQDSGPALLR